MLLGQERGGRQEGDLSPTGHGHKSRAQGHFGLTKAHIATDQAVHRARADHVLDDGVDGGFLVGGFFKAKIVGEGFVVLRAVAKRVAYSSGAARVNVEQLGRGVAHLFGGLAFGLFPLAAAELVQGRFVGAHAGVAANEVQLAHGHIQHRVCRVLEVQELLQRGRAVGVDLAHVHVDEPAVAANAVRAVHHRVAHVELGEVFDQRLHIADLFLLAPSPRRAVGREQLGLGDQVHRVLKPSKARVQRGRGDADALVARHEFV